MESEVYSHEEQLLLAEALLQDSSHEHTPQTASAKTKTGLVSRDFIASLSAEVDALLKGSVPLNDVRAKPRPVEEAPGTPSPKERKDGWCIRRPETQLGVFGPPPRREQRAASAKGGPPATYERNLEFVKQREAKLESARKHRDDQELGQLAAPSLTQGSRKLVAASYSPPWDGKKSYSTSCRAQKVLRAALESKAQEEAEHTFKPAINKRSQAIFRHVIDTGQPWHDRVHAGDRPGKPPGTKALTPEEPEHSFRPQISKKAAQLRREGHVSERLYGGTKASEPQKTPALKKRISKMLARECLAQSSAPGEAEAESAEPTGEPAATPRSAGVSKLVEALRLRAEKGENTGGEISPARPTLPRGQQADSQTSPGGTGSE